MKRVAVYEYLSAGHAGGDTADAELAAAGRAMRDAVARDLAGVPGWRVSCVSHGGLAVPAGCHAIDAPAGEDAFDFAGRVARAHDLAWVIAPETGRLLERLQAVVGDERWIGCDAAAIRLAASKQATAGRLMARGIATPATCLADARSARWIVKPDDGAGCGETRLHARIDTAKADWTERLRRRCSATLEPWVDGDALSLSLVCSPGHARLLSINRQRIASHDGRLRFDGVDIGAIGDGDARAPALRRLASDVAAAIPGLSGFVGIDVVWHAAHGPVVIEVNPRVTCAYVGLSARLGRNLAAEVLGARQAVLQELAGA